MSLFIPKYSIPSGLETVLERFSRRTEKVWKYCTADEEKYTNLLNKLRMYKRVDISDGYYKEILRIGLYIETYQDRVELAQFNCNVTVSKAEECVDVDIKQEIQQARRYSKYPRLYLVKFLANFIEEPPCRRKDPVILCNGDNTEEKFELIIERINPKYLLVSISSYSSFISKHPEISNFKLKFCPNSFPYDCCHFSLLEMEHQVIKNRIFPNACDKTVDVTRILPGRKFKHIREFKWMNKNIEDNEQQKLAVVSIFNKLSHPAPFILYGPPGTGKTSTIIEAILQIIEADRQYINNIDSKKHRILVCTPSNSAADTIVQRLIQSGLQPHELIRLNSGSRDTSLIDPLIRIYSCLGRINTVHALTATKTVVICTLCFCTRLILKKIKDFSYIFIDESGQATESDTLIPFNMDSDSHIVIAGDPMQLGPVVKAKLAEPIIGMSMMERLMDLELYKRDTNHNYDLKYVVQLLNNYRSHPTIIQQANELFYEQVLQSRGCNDERILKCWSCVPEKFYPINFIQVQGIESKEGKSPSPYNPQEVDVVVQYVKRIIGMKLNGCIIGSDSIGIITPFTMQSKKIQEKLASENLQNVEVGTVELFQGREKDIIIISAVRSKIFHHRRQNHLGFLSNSKRFNVAITRAKAFMVIIGNCHILKNDMNWLKIINTCIKNRSCYGVSKQQKQLPKPWHCCNDQNVMFNNNATISASRFLFYIPMWVPESVQIPDIQPILEKIFPPEISDSDTISYDDLPFDKKWDIIFERMESILQKLDHIKL